MQSVLDKINEWNRSKRFSRAYLDADGDAVVEMDLNLRGGVTRDNIEANFSNWRLILDQFTAHIGFK